MTFGENLNSLLKKYQRSQRWLAKTSGVHYVTINRIIKGYPFRVTQDTAQRLAKAIGCNKKERDELIKLAGGIPKDVEEILLSRPDLIETVRKLAKQ
jgi:hypothetical protein